MNIRWITDDKGNLVLFKFGDYGSHCSPVPAEHAAKRDKMVVVKAIVDEKICIETPLDRRVLTAINDLYALLNPLAEQAAERLLAEARHEQRKRKSQRRNRVTRANTP